MWLTRLFNYHLFGWLDKRTSSSRFGLSIQTILCIVLQISKNENCKITLLTCCRCPVWSTMVLRYKNISIKWKFQHFSISNFKCSALKTNSCLSLWPCNSLYVRRVFFSKWNIRCTWSLHASIMIVVASLRIILKPYLESLILIICNFK